MSHGSVSALITFLAVLHVFKCDLVYPSIVNKYGEFQTSNLSAYVNHVTNNSLWYKFTFNNETIVINLTLSRHLIPGLGQCQFKGKVSQDLNTQAAFSVCNGLVSK